MIRHGVTFAAAAVAVVLCMLLTPIPGHVAFVVTPLVVVSITSLAALSAGVAWRGYRHQRLTARLHSWAHPTTLADIPVQQLPGADAAFVAGLRRPQIFCSPELPASLAPDELRAVLLHERYHQLDRAPAKLLLLETLAPVVTRVSAGRAWLARRVAELEIAADRHAIEHGSSRPVLARALLKLGPAAQTAAGVGIGFASATDLRLRALLDDQQPPPARLPSGWLVGPVVVAVGCVLLALPV